MESNKRMIPCDFLEPGKVYEIPNKVIFRVHKELDFGYLLEVLERNKSVRRYERWSKDSFFITLVQLRGFHIYHLKYYDTPLWKAINGGD